MSATDSTSLAAPLIRAVVHACDIETTYLRAGRGNAMVLVADDLDRPEVRETIAALSREFLVLAAAPALRDPASLARWLREFLECLGVAGAHIALHQSASDILLGDSVNA